MSKAKIFKIRCPFYTRCQPPDYDWPLCASRPRDCNEFGVYEKDRVANLRGSKSVKHQ